MPTKFPCKIRDKKTRDNSEKKYKQCDYITKEVKCENDLNITLRDGNKYKPCYINLREVVYMNENLDEKLKDLLIRLLEDQENVEITVLPPAKAKKEKTA